MPKDKKHTYSKHSLPKEIIVIPNRDKKQNEKWDEARMTHPANFPCPNRFILVGRPGSGKSLCLQNILLRSRPLYDVLVLVHPDGKISREWEDFEPTYVFEEPPGTEFFEQLIKKDGTFPKTAIVIDDIELYKQRKEILSNIATIMRYYSTHRYVSCFLTFQSFFDIPSIYRKLASVFIIYRPLITNEFATIENRLGMPKGRLRYLFDSLCHKPTDFIVVDHSNGSPMPLRFGLFQKIDIEDEYVPDDEPVKKNTKEISDDEDILF